MYVEREKKVHMRLQLKRPLAFIDLETTGLNEREDRIVDICITKVFPNGEEQTLNSLINPTIPIPLESTKIHRIKDVDVQNKESFRDFAGKIITFLDNCDLCGFGMKFDLAVLESEFRRIGISFTLDGRDVLDIQQIYFKMERRDLQAAHLKYCGKTFENAHSASADVKATIDILKSQLELYPELPDSIGDLRKFCRLKEPSWVDDEGKLAWYNGEMVINFSKDHKGKTLKAMVQENPGFLDWMMQKDFSPEVKTIISEAIKGNIPTRL